MAQQPTPSEVHAAECTPDACAPGCPWAEAIQRMSDAELRAYIESMADYVQSPEFRQRLIETGEAAAQVGKGIVDCLVSDDSIHDWILKRL